MPTTAEIIWVAAWLEGEGTFGIAKPSCPVIAVGSIDRDVVDRFARIVNNSANTFTWTGNLWRYQISGVCAAQWMMTILPLMGRRRSARIKECLNAWKNAQRAFARSKRTARIAARIGTRCPQGHLIVGENVQMVEQRGMQYVKCKICNNDLVLGGSKYAQCVAAEESYHAS